MGGFSKQSKQFQLNQPSLRQLVKNNQVTLLIAMTSRGTWRKIQPLLNRAVQKWMSLAQQSLSYQIVASAEPSFLQRIAILSRKTFSRRVMRTKCAPNFSRQFLPKRRRRRNCFPFDVNGLNCRWLECFLKNTLLDGQCW